MSPSITKGLRNAFEGLGCRAGLAFYPGEEAYPFGRNVFTLPIKDLEKVLISQTVEK